MANKKSLLCNETKYVPKERWNAITFHFVTDDQNTLSDCTVRLGDIDPLSGDPISDVTLFSDYYRQVNREVHVNLKQIRMRKTEAERQKTERLKARLSDEFEKEHGYKPNEDNLRLLLEKAIGSPYILVPNDAILNQEDDTSGLEDWSPYSVPFEDPLGDEPSVMVQAMLTVGASLTGRLKEVYDALQRNIESDGPKEKKKDLARRLGVSPSQITKDIRKIAALIMEKSAELIEE